MKRRTVNIIGFILGGLLGTCVALSFHLYQAKTELEATQQELAEYKADECEIYPCPFCGSKDVQIVDIFGKGTDCYVKCKNCLGDGPAKNPNTGSWDISKAEAIELWNTRKPSEQ